MTAPEMKILAELISDIDKATEILGQVPFIANVRARLYVICERAPRTYVESEMKESFEAGFRSSGEEFNGETGYSMYRMGTFADFIKEFNLPKP